MKTQRNKNTKYNILIVILLLCVIAGVFNGVVFLSRGVDLTEPVGTYNIYTMEEFVEYSRKYAAGYRNPEDVLNISITSGSDITNSDFVSLGTSDRPFKGTIVIPTAGIDTFRLSNCPLFDYVSTDMKLTGAGTVKIIRKRAEETPTSGVLTSGALFANHVVKGTDAANWSIALLPYSGAGEAATSFEGLIGDIADNAEVTITFANTSALNVSGAGDIGLICGTLGEGATLNVTTAGSGSNITVSTTGGNAGSLVGTMGSGSTLKLNSDNLSRVNSVTTTSGYAGGLVGYADNITVQFGTGVSDYEVSGTVTGKTGAGGLFGYYKTSAASATFDMEGTFKLASGIDISSTTYTGGVFGLLENTGASFTFDGNGDTTGANAENLNFDLVGGSARGGICGGYKTSALTNAFTIINSKPTVNTTTLTNNNYSGGLIGKVVGDNAAYILIDGEEEYNSSTNANPIFVTVTGSANGGLIGNLGEKGSFVDVKGNVKVSGSCTAGIIDNMTEGVLRLQGTTDLSGCTTTSVFVNTRGRALIYALGTGSNAAINTSGETPAFSGWTVQRNTSNYVDDIGSWGQVLRVDGTILAESNLFTVDGTAHTVTVNAAVNAMTSVTDFAKTALNIKLNTNTAVGALLFADTTNKSTALLADDLSLTANISLAGTGLTGLTRDNGANNAFSGTFNGNGHTLTFATGEAYGKNGDTVLTSANSTLGNIRKHIYNGLFAKISGANASKGKVYDLILDGNFYVKQGADKMRIGGVAAQAGGYCTVVASNNNTFKINFDTGVDNNGYIGGVIGEVIEGATVSVKSYSTGSINPIFVDASTISGNTNHTCVGGAIGCVAASETSQKITFEDGTQIGLNYTKSDGNNRASVFGAAIGRVVNCAYVKDRRQINFGTSGTVTVDITANGKANGKFGAILGCEWYAADVTINNINVNSASITASAATNFGGLVQTATGHWDIKAISLTSANFNVPGGGSFGFVCNKAYVNGDTNKSALYLDVTDASYGISALTFTGTPTFTVFDELVADSRFNSNDITNNGNAIISITTSGGTEGLITTDGSAYNTYLNKTVYGRTVANKQINPNTRYYYNIAYARDNLETQKYNFLVFTVGKYAHSSLADWFPATNTFSGDLDMTGLSYYPIDLTSGVTFSNVTVLKLDNNLMEDAVKYAYYYEHDGVKSSDTRTTRSNTNQHYLMHTAIFRNVTANITISGANGATLQGNVPKLSDSFCGFLVAGTLGGSDTVNVKFNASKIVCDGVHITTSTGADITDTAYAPLIINKIGKATTVTINGAAQSTTAYSDLCSMVSGSDYVLDDTSESGFILVGGHKYRPPQSGESAEYALSVKYAGSSLIGDVGDDTARAIYLNFAGLKFDGRASNSSDGNFYGSSRSIFSRATILNKFQYAGESSGTYNFYWVDDYDGTPDPHNVTYGYEITGTSEHIDTENGNVSKQRKYFKDADHTEDFFVDPTSSSNNTSQYASFGNFLPYVYTAYNAGNKTHELKVNISVTLEIEGVGKYDRPYIIDTGEKLKIVSDIIRNAGASGATVYLPSDYTSCDYTTVTDPSDDIAVTNTNDTASDTKKYFAGAYYVISSDIELPTDYESLGTVSEAQYAFRGVIVGRNTTVTIHNDKPLIKSAMGAVIKDLTVKVDVDIPVEETTTNVITLAAPTGSATYVYSYSSTANIQSYGAVIEQVLGGDTIIDNVQVTFTDAVFNITKESSSNYERLVPIGGYIGTLVNGGVIFRNMAPAEGKNYSGLTSSTLDKVADSGYLYVNPIIGRVIAGYAFYEKTSGTIDENTVTVVNGNKNYTISDLVLTNDDSKKLGVTSSYDVTIPNGQSIYVLGAIVNSGAGAASNYNEAYDGLSDFWQAYRAHTTVRGGSHYSTVGSTTGYDFTAAKNDSYTDGLNKTPYIIQAYTTYTTVNDTNIYYARAVARKDLTINVTGDCDVPAGFRGIGSIYTASGNTQLTINSMTGQKTSTSSYQIKLNMRYLEYNHNYLITSTSPYTASPYIAYADNTGSLAGFGLFNKLNINGASDSKCVQYLELAGSIYYDVYKIDGTQAGYTFANYYTDDKNADRTDYTAKLGTGDETNARTILSVGGIAGVVNSKFYLRNVTFNNLAVEGAKTAGGLIGFVFIDDTTNTISTIDYTAGITNAGYVNVIGGQCAGGLIGRIYRAAVEIKGASGGTNIIIKDIKSKNTVPNETGMRYFANITTGVGGLVGNCWATDRKVSNGGNDAGNVPFTGATGSRKLHISDINVVKGTSAANISVEHDSDSYYNYAGGFVGSAHNVWLKITDSKLIGVNVTANTAGGFVGKVSQKYYLEIIGCTVDGNSKSASISGTRFAGGVVGWCIGRDYLYFQLLNSTVKDYIIQSVMTGENIAGAGGMVGYAEGNKTVIDASTSHICQFNNLAVLDCDIKTNYTNSTSNLKYKNGTGGIIGVIDTVNIGDNFVTLNLAFYLDTSSKNHRDSSQKYKFSGYNILVKDCTLTHKNGGSSDDSTSATNSRIGDLVGNNSVETPIKWVGVSVENTGYYIDASTNGYCGKHVGYWKDDNDKYGIDPSSPSGARYYGDGYVVFANYNGVTGGDTLSNIDNGTDVPAAYPYNTVNPAFDIGGKHITGDGVSDSVANLPIQNILTGNAPSGDPATYSGIYKYAASADYSDAVDDDADTNYTAFNANVGKLVMFRSEVPTYLGDDFPVLLVDSINSDETHKLINSYLRLLTNTKHDFGVDSSGEYEVEIYNMSFDNGVFVPSATGASLKRKDNQFCMSALSFDSGKTQFSLIDVRFFDPANSSQVAYHLYVPVFVKKVMTYQFDIAVLSGTDYLKSTYTPYFGDPLIENTGTPVTFFFRYTYSKTNADGSGSTLRTTTEWQNAINAGENVNRNYEKKLMFYKANTNDILKDFPSGTVLVLVDPNRGGTPYYATVETAFSGLSLNLSAFKSIMTKDGDTVTFSGDSFSPVNLDQIMNVSLTQNNSGTLVRYIKATRGGVDHLYRLATAEEQTGTTYTISGSTASVYTSGEDPQYVEVECDNSEVVIYDGTHYYHYKTDADTTPGLYYTAQVTDTPIMEQYYLSVFTESNAVNDELFHYYLVTSPSAFDETAYPSRISDTGAHTLVHLVMGKIFYHDHFSISSQSGHGESFSDAALLMTNENDTLKVTMSAEMGISNTLPTEIRSNMVTMVANVNVYQGFLVYLNREESPNSYKAILGSPTGVGSYQIDSGATTTYDNIDVNQNFAEFITGDLHSNFATGDNFTVSATVTLTYSESAIPTQFPGKANNEHNGTWVSGSSNIAFSSGAVANSKNRLSEDETPQKRYYSEAEPDVATLDLNPIGDRVGDFTPLGINALNNDDMPTATFDLLAVLDVTNIVAQIADYTDAIVTVTLLQKQEDATYAAIDDISQYITGFAVGNSAFEIDQNESYTDYTKTIAKANLSDENGVEITLPVLRFTIKTGSAFEDENLTYGNYRVNVSVRLEKEGVPITSSQAENYVIYSNVKVIPYYID